MFVPDCVQRSAAAGFYGDVSDGDDVSAVGGACLLWLRLQHVNIHLRSETPCKWHRGCWMSDQVSLASLINKIINKIVGIVLQKKSYWMCVFVSLTICVCLSVSLISSSSGWSQSGSNNSWIFTFQEVLSQLEVTLTHNNNIYSHTDCMVCIWSRNMCLVLKT